MEVENRDSSPIEARIRQFGWIWSLESSWVIIMARTRGCGLIKCWINTGGQVCLRTNHERALMCVITIMDARQIWHTWGDEDFSRLRRDLVIHFLLLLIFLSNFFSKYRHNSNENSYKLQIMKNNLAPSSFPIPFLASRSAHQQIPDPHYRSKISYLLLSHPVLPCVLRRRAREREREKLKGEREREERKKKERRRNGS